MKIQTNIATSCTENYKLSSRKSTKKEWTQIIQESQEFLDNVERYQGLNKMIGYINLLYHISAFSLWFQTNRNFHKKLKAMELSIYIVLILIANMFSGRPALQTEKSVLELFPEFDSLKQDYEDLKQHYQDIQAKLAVLPSGKFI